MIIYIFPVGIKLESNWIYQKTPLPPPPPLPHPSHTPTPSLSLNHQYIPVIEFCSLLVVPTTIVLIVPIRRRENSVFWELEIKNQKRKESCSAFLDLYICIFGLLLPGLCDMPVLMYIVHNISATYYAQ